MAYLDLNAFMPPVTACAARVPGLSPRERAVVRLALRDPLRSLRRETMIDRLARRLCGIRRPAPLACPRLEALRRAVVLARHDPAQASTGMLRLRDAGFTAAAIAEARARVMAAARMATPSLKERAGARLAPLAHGATWLGAAWLEGGVAGAAALVALPLLRCLQGSMRLA